MDCYINELAWNAKTTTTVTWRLLTASKITIHKELSSSQHLINPFTENENAVNRRYTRLPLPVLNEPEEFDLPLLPLLLIILTVFRSLDSLSLLCTCPVREALNGGWSILRMEVLGAEQGRCRCCCCQWLKVHVTTGARLFGPGRATASRGVPVHTGTLTTCHFPTVGREGGGKNEEGCGEIWRNQYKKERRMEGKDKETIGEQQEHTE